MKRRSGITAIVPFVVAGVIVVPGSGLHFSSPTAEGRPLAFVQAPKSAAPSTTPTIGNTILAGRYTQGMRIALADFENLAGTVRVVTEGFECATDPVFAFDGTRLAFAGKRNPADPLQVWELADDFVRLTQVVTCDADCVSPLYVPDGHMVFASLLAREYEEHGGHFSFSLYRAGPSGEKPSRITFNPSSDFDPHLLLDGRILFSSWQHVGNHHWPRGMIALMLVNADGSGVFPFSGNHDPPWVKRGGKSWAGDRVAFIQSGTFGEFGAGELVTVSLNNPFAAYKTVVSGDQYQISDVAPLPDGRLLASARPADGSRPTFGLYIYEAGAWKLLYDDPEFHELVPAVGGIGVQPELYPSTLAPGATDGELAILNCYETDRTDQHPLKKESVKLVRVLEGMPLRFDGRTAPTFLPNPGFPDEPLIRPNSATGYIPTRILGEVAPAPDGSVHLTVPADRPLRIQLVDHDGFAIINERAWFWVRPGERRVCIGCHENRELAPVNAVPLAVRRAPTDLTDRSSWQTISFRRDVQPVVGTRCAATDCHVPPFPTADMNLAADSLNGKSDAPFAERFGPAYANLLARQENKPFAVGGRRVHPGDARSSPMMWMLYGRALAPQYTPAPFERTMISAHPGPMLPDAQLELIRKWIDLGAQYDDDSPPGPWPYQAPSGGKVATEGDSGGQ